MNKSRRLVAVGIAVLLVAVACSSSKKSASTATTGGTTASTQSTAGNTASDVGVTPTQITLGNVSTLTGPIPGLFAGGPAGTDAYFQYINSQGGVFGRKLVLKTGDDGLNCNQYLTQVQALAPTVFGFVGSWSDFDNCGANYFTANPTIPDVHYLLQNQTYAEPNGFTPQPQPPGFRTGPYQYYEQQYPNAVKHVAGLWAATSTTTWTDQKAAMQSVGFTIVYDRAIQATETDFTADIVRMKSLGVQYLDLRNEDETKIAAVMNAAAQQNWHPQVVITNSEYDATFVHLLSNASNGAGILTDQPFAMFLGEDAQSTPSVALFNTWMKKTHPSQKVDLFAMFSWASAELFVDALKQAGQNPTRQGVLTAIKGMHNFDANGLLAAADVGNKKPPACWMLLQVQPDGTFKRILPTGSGYTCNPTGYFYAQS
ncbi:MAG TPA: ABC transporter substrate-binding protein [Acidimicrobiales bacterium]|jgi:ABC-type branched-subunit amino acid transport system substrate-binding protein